MSFSYDINLGDEVSWVRLLIGDLTATTAALSDEEITAALADSTISSTRAKRYYVAADLLSTLHMRWMTLGQGVASKKLSKLSIAFGTGIGINVDAAVDLKVKELRRKGAEILSPRPFGFGIL